MKINPIETRYAGCRFRSRLEARWAVFLDRLGIAWEYEPQGYECSARLTDTGYGEPIRYLPDFWLPELGVFGEVKGQLDTKSLTRLLDVAAALSSNNGGGCHDAGGNDLVVFGSVPYTTASGGCVPTQLHMHKGDLQWSPWTGETGVACPWRGQRIASDNGGYIYDDLNEILAGPSPDVIALELLNGSWSTQVPTEMADAFTAARSARFEYGESGA